jgi:hypothetical protein
MNGRAPELLCDAQAQSSILLQLNFLLTVHQLHSARGKTNARIGYRVVCFGKMIEFKFVVKLRAQYLMKAETCKQNLR